jgi:hypothetical protein
MYQLISTVGLEYEVENCGAHELMGALNGHVFKQTHDASIESDVSFRRGMYVESPKNLLSHNGSGTVIGTEIITIPFDTETEDLLPYLKGLTQTLMAFGEPEKSLRAGIHVHVNMSYNLRILKSIIRLGMHLEDVFFHIGTQGYVFRGMKVNDNAYCRPITKWGPQIITNGNGAYPVFVAKDLLEATNVKDFWYRYGSLTVTNENSGPGAGWNRYSPQRYTWLNLYSLLLHGTLEFRVFNKTMSPFRINAEIKLCQKFCEFAIKTGFSELKELGFLRINSIYDRRNRGDILDTFDKFCEMVEFDKENMLILRNILITAPDVVFPEQYIWTHLERGRSWWGAFGYCPSRVDSDTVKTPEIVDIHAMRGERRPN